MDRHGALIAPETSPACTADDANTSETGACNVSSGAEASAPAVRAAAPLPSAKQTVTLAVENMVCGGCMRKVETALAAVPGVISARANLSAKRATVVFGNPQQVDAAKLVGALDAIGFRSAEFLPEAMLRRQTNRNARRREHGLRRLHA